MVTAAETARRANYERYRQLLAFRRNVDAREMFERQDESEKKLRSHQEFADDVQARHGNDLDDWPFQPWGDPSRPYKTMGEFRVKKLAELQGERERAKEAHDKLEFAERDHVIKSLAPLLSGGGARQRRVARTKSGGRAVGSRVQVWNGTAHHTRGGVTKAGLMRKNGRLVSRRASAAVRRRR